MPDRITFSFGENWERFLDAMPEHVVAVHAAYVADWLGDLHGQRLVDIGSGQGLLSLAAHQAGADVTSFDVDPHAVTATRRTWERVGRPASWRVEDASILDDGFVRSLGTFDVVLSWGVLHHTGAVWHAIDNAAALVAPGGRLWLALYTRTYWSRRSLRTKRLYNRTPGTLKPLFRVAWASPKIAKMVARRDLSRLRGYRDARGMDFWRDVEDWLGGLPYEPVTPGEVLARLAPRGFVLERLESALGEGGNDVYLFRLTTRPAA